MGVKTLTGTIRLKGPSDHTSTTSSTSYNQKRSIANALSRLSLASQSEKAKQIQFNAPKPSFITEVIVISSSEDESPDFSRGSNQRGYCEACITLTPELSTVDQVCVVDITSEDSADKEDIRRSSSSISSPTHAKRQSSKKRRASRQPTRHRYSKRRSGEPLLTYTISPSIGEERYRNVPTLNHGVEIRDSTIPSAGRGLFASRHFKKGELVTEYVGEIITRDEARRRLRRGQFHYLGTLVTGMYEIDGIQEPQDNVGAASFINHARKPHANVQWAHVEDRRACFRRLFAKACRDIDAGEEIFLDYGKTYWEHHRRWKLALEKGKDALSDETLSDEELYASDTSDINRNYHGQDFDRGLYTSKDTSGSSSFRVNVSTTGGDDGESTSESNYFLSQFTNEFHLYPCEPPSRMPQA